MTENKENNSKEQPYTQKIGSQNKALKIMTASLVALLFFTVAYFFLDKNQSSTDDPNISKDDLVKVIHENFVDPSTAVSDIEIIDIEKEGVFYKADINLKGEKSPLYVNENGDKFFFQEMINLEEFLKEREIANASISDKLKLSDLNLAKVTPEDKILGSENADYFIVEYSDLECPFCKRYNESIAPLKEKYKDDSRVSFVFRHFPLDAPYTRALHPTATEEAIALECVYELAGDDAAFQFIDQIFASSSSDGKYDLEKLKPMAVALGVDGDEYSACYDNEETEPRVREEFQSGTQAGVSGTPSIFIQDSEGQSVKVNADRYEIENALDFLLK